MTSNHALQRIAAPLSDFYQSFDSFGCAPALARELSRKGLGTWKGGKPRGGSPSVVIKGEPVSQIVVDERR